MTFQAFHGDADKALSAKNWGIKFYDRDNVLKDVGLQEFVEEFVRMLQSQGPIVLNEPLKFLNNTNGNAIEIYNQGPLVQHKGIGIRDVAGNRAQLGIGLGSEGINANSYNPHPLYALRTDAVHQFYSLAGNNANADPNHPQAVAAGHGLVGLPGLYNNTNYTTPFFLNSMFNSWQYSSTTCGNYYRFNHHNDTIYWPTYVPARIEAGVAQQDIARDASGTVELDDGTDVQAQNPFFEEIEENDDVILACVGGSWIILGAPIAETRLVLATALADHPRNDFTSYNIANPPEQFDDVLNAFFGCIEEGDECLILVDEENGSLVVSAPEKLFFSQGGAVNSIGKGQHGQVALQGGGTVDAFSPMAAVDAGSAVLVIRDTSQTCGEWTIIAAECPDSSVDGFNGETPSAMPEDSFGIIDYDTSTFTEAV